MYYRSIKEVKTALPNDVRDTKKKKKKTCSDSQGGSKGRNIELTCRKDIIK